jgi:hypothetical protein
MRWLVLASLCLGAGGVACSAILGDFAVTPSGPGDAGPGNEASAADSTVAEAGEEPAGPCQAVASTSDVYLGQAASIDGSKSIGANLSYSWTVQRAPTGSHVTTASLNGGHSATASFVADVAGDYELALAISSASCAGSTAMATLTARSPRVIFAQGQVTDAGAWAAYTVADLDGGNAHGLLCPDTLVTAVPDQIATLAAYAGRAYDFWEAPSGQPSKYAAFTVDQSADAFSTHLWVGTTESSCSLLPSDLTSVGFGPGPPFGAGPHFNADGSRFVVYDAQWNIVTYSADGAKPGNLVASYSAGQSGPPDFDASLDPLPYGGPAEPPRVEWTTTGLAWARATPTGWEIATALDMPGSPVSSYMQCSGVTPRQIAMLRDGTVIAGYRQTPGSGEDIYLLKPNSSQACVVEQKYTSSSDAGTSTATDFAVSPDGKWLAYLALDPTVQDAAPWKLPPDGLYPGGYVYVVAIASPEAGTPQPQRVSTDPALYGPRWIGGGTRLVFTRLDGTTGTAPATSVVVVSPDGGGETVVARGDGVNSFVSTSGSGSCSVTTGSRDGAFGLGMLGALVGIGCYRRRAWRLSSSARG